MSIFSAGTNVASQYLQRRLAKPPLIRETSRKSLLLNPWASLKVACNQATIKPLERLVADGLVGLEHGSLPQGEPPGWHGAQQQN
jgi:hypothetical protein